MANHDVQLKTGTKPGIMFPADIHKLGLGGSGSGSGSGIAGGVAVGARVGREDETELLSLMVGFVLAG